MKQQDKLILVLLDESADEASRDDAAMDLGAFDDYSAEAALIQIASSPKTPEIVCASCGESLAEIWVRKKEVNSEAFRSLCSPAKAEAEACMYAKSPLLLSS